MVNSGLNGGPDTGPNDFEVQKKMEDEHLRLMRQVRMVQADRQNETLGVHPMFRREDTLLKTLKKEYIDLTTDLKIATSGAHSKTDRRTKAIMKKSISNLIETEQKQDEGNTVIEQLEGLLQRNSKRMLDLRKAVTSVMGMLEDRKLQSEVRLTATENKLETAKLRFNAVQHENKHIREEIEHMLKDRAHFIQSWNKMISALKTGKKFLTDLFESSTLAYDQREEWVSKLTSLQEKGKMDQALQVQEMRDLQKTYDNDMKLFHFLATKGIKRVNTKEDERDDIRKAKEEEEVKARLEEHQKILDEISDYACENQVKKIMDNFEKKEQENFSIYKLLTEHCAENVYLGKSLAALRQTLQDRQDWMEAKEAQRDRNLQKLQEELEERKTRTAQLRARDDEQQHLLQYLMGKITEMFNMLGCSLEPFQNLLGDKQPSIRRLRLTLQLITEKIKENIEVVYYNERHGPKKQTSATFTASRLKKFTIRPDPPQLWKAPPLSVLVPADPCPACIETRWMCSVRETREEILSDEEILAAIRELSSDASYERSDRIHLLSDCRAPRSRHILAKRYVP